MGDDSSKAPLTRRVPGATRAGPASLSRPELPPELLQRMQAVVNAAHAQARQEEEAPAKQAAPDQSSPRRGFGVGGGPKSSNGARPKLTVRGRLSDVDAESDTDELPRLTASGAIASSALASTTTARPSGSAPPDQVVRPRRGDHAAKRDRRAEKRERAAQAERARAERAEQAAQAERERAREAELAARAVQVLRERERAAREQAEREAAERGERERAAREQAQREAAERAERERAERERAARAERERAEREAAALAERERAAQAERERAEREERDRAARERERAAQQRAAQAARERAVREQAERERATQLELEQAERAAQAEREEAEREQAERERAVQAEWAAPAVAETDKAAPPDSTASPNGTIKPEGIVKPDGIAQPDGRGLAAAARADVLVYPRRAARQRPVRRRRYRTIALIAAAAVVVAAGPIAIMLSRHSTPPPDGSGSGLRNEAAAWISQQVTPGDTVACDVTMCQTLEGYGVPVGYLLVLNAGQRDLLNSKVIVSTAAIRQLFGSRLDAYAPVVLASFGSGKARIDIRVIAQRGSAAYLSQLSTDVQERKNLGGELAALSSLTLSATAQKQLMAGQVDIRLQVDLTSLLDSGRVNVLAFGDLFPGASPDVPLRSVYLAETGAASNVRAAIASLRGPGSPYNPWHAESVRFNGKPALYIEFAAPTPLGLFPN
jgi:hypothetical protein